MALVDESDEVSPYRWVTLVIDKMEKTVTAHNHGTNYEPAKYFLSQIGEHAWAHCCYILNGGYINGLKAMDIVQRKATTIATSVKDQGLYTVLGIWACAVLGKKFPLFYAEKEYIGRQR